MYDYGTHIISETLGDMWDGRLPDDQRQAILQRIDRAVSRYWQHPFRRAQDGNDHPIDPKTGEIIIKKAEGLASDSENEVAIRELEN